MIFWLAALSFAVFSAIFLRFVLGRAIFYFSARLSRLRLRERILRAQSGKGSLGIPMVHLFDALFTFGGRGKSDLYVGSRLDALRERFALAQSLREPPTDELELALKSSTLDPEDIEAECFREACDLIAQSALRLPRGGVSSTNADMVARALAIAVGRGDDFGSAAAVERVLKVAPLTGTEAFRLLTAVLWMIGVSARSANDQTNNEAPV